jgi:hypothetical protein
VWHDGGEGAIDNQLIPYRTVGSSSALVASALRDVRDLSKPIQQELEKFFIATDELEDKKLEIIGRKGARTAARIIRLRVAAAFGNQPPLSRDSCAAARAQRPLRA